MNVAFLVEMHKYTSVMRRRSEPPKRKIAQRKAFYYLRSTDRKPGFSDKSGGTGAVPGSQQKIPPDPCDDHPQRGDRPGG